MATMGFPGMVVFSFIIRYSNTLTYIYLLIITFYSYGHMYLCFYKLSVKITCMVRQIKQLIFVTRYTDEIINVL